MEDTPKTSRSRGHITPEPSRTRSAASPPRQRIGRGLLTTRQKAVIATEARKAFQVQDRHGFIDREPGDSDSAVFAAWRHHQQQQAVGEPSLRNCRNHHFRPLLAHFLTLQGKDDKAFALHLRSGKVRDHAPVEDTHERREELRHLILQAFIEHGERLDPKHPRFDLDLAAEVARRGGPLGAGYIQAIARRKHRRSLDSLTAADLEKLLYTARNRIAAREGRGDPANRNQSQRRR